MSLSIEQQKSIRVMSGAVRQPGGGGGGVTPIAEVATWSIRKRQPTSPKERKEGRAVRDGS